MTLGRRARASLPAQMYLIDTDILIYSLKGHPGVVASFVRHRRSPKSVSVVSYGELLYGARSSRQQQKNLATAHRIAELFPIIPVTQAVIETFAELRAELNAAGLPLDDMDLLIASTALSQNLVLVTNNERHFSRVSGLSLENWSESE